MEQIRNSGNSFYHANGIKKLAVDGIKK